MDSEYIMNSSSYWNWRYLNNWEDFKGSLQSEFFAKLLIGNLPYEIFTDIFNNKYKILDWGCAKGQLCFEWYKTFHIQNIYGLDFSVESIKQAQKIYPNLSFTSSPLLKEDKYDIIVTSNTLEHLPDWKSYLELFTQISQKYIIILVPYESEIFDEHVVSFNKNSFNININEFSKIFEKIINTDDSGFWNGNQYLCIYKKD